MSWFRENRFLSLFLVALSAGTIGAATFLSNARSDWKDAMSGFRQSATELNRLEGLAPYPTRENLRRMKEQTEEYAAALDRMKDDLRARELPLQPMAPNEFQSHLRLARSRVAEKALAGRIRLPERFCLGFDEYASRLPAEAIAPFLGRELAQIEWLMDVLFEARIQALTSFHRVPLASEHGALSVASIAGHKTGVRPTPAPILLERNVVEATFVSTPAAARKVLNQIADASQGFLIVRLLHIRNEKDKGPPREAATDGANVAFSNPALAPGLATGPTPPGLPLNFIVGQERIETTAKIEIVRWTF